MLGAANMLWFQRKEAAGLLLKHEEWLLQAAVKAGSFEELKNFTFTASHDFMTRH